MRDIEGIGDLFAQAIELQVEREADALNGRIAMAECMERTATMDEGLVFLRIEWAAAIDASEACFSLPTLQP